MNTTTSIFAADLFCGAGGTSTGLLQAAQELGLSVDLVAVNHWDIAIATHKENHPEVQHFNSDLVSVDPRQAVPSGHLRLLVASPECTHFSRARGGKPKNKQSRASIKYVLRWIKNLNIEDVLIENVPDFLDWGPLHSQCTCGVGKFFDKDHAKKCLYGKPIKERKGEYFYRFIQKVRKLGYQVDWRILNAANYGDPTTRERLFIIARKHKAIAWPEPTHLKPHGIQVPMFNRFSTWRTAREIIDWSVPGQSIYTREQNGKKPLVANTMRRIYAGLEKFCGLPFVIGQQSSAAPRSIDEPVPTVATAGAIAMIQPFLISQEHSNGKLQPFIATSNHGKATDRAYSVDQPMKTITSVDAWALIQPKLTPYLVAYYGDDGRVHSVDNPLPTVVTENRFGLCEPYLVKYYGSGDAIVSVDEPLPTVTVRDRFALCQPLLFKINETVYMLDILYRMLTWYELAAAQGFTPGYKFHGSREDKVKQIGNSVPPHTAKALCKVILQ